MRYWGASALAPLVLAEGTSRVVRRLLAEDPLIVTSAWTRVELVSAVERRTREGLLTRIQRRSVLERFALLWENWDEVTDLLAVRSRAVPLLARHPLRAADAGQLAAALLIADHDPSDLGFVCLDGRLAAAAEGEGLRVLPGTEWAQWVIHEEAGYVFLLYSWQGAELPHVHVEKLPGAGGFGTLRLDSEGEVAWDFSRRLDARDEAKIAEIAARRLDAFLSAWREHLAS